MALRTRSLCPRPVSVLALCCVFAAAATMAGENGHIQVKCEPGVCILLDGTLKGVATPELKGLIIQNVPPGRHVLRAEKQGFKPQEETVLIEPGQVLVHTVRPFVPGVTIEEEGDETGVTIEAGIGTLIIQSLPVDCVVHIPTVGLDKHPKTKDRLKATGARVGVHRGTFSGMGKTLEKDISLEPEQTVRVFVNFVTGEVEVTVLSEPKEPVPLPPPAAVEAEPPKPKPKRREPRNWLQVSGGSGAPALTISTEFWHLLTPPRDSWSPILGGMVCLAMYPDEEEDFSTAGLYVGGGYQKPLTDKLSFAGALMLGARREIRAGSAAELDNGFEAGLRLYLHFDVGNRDAKLGISVSLFTGVNAIDEYGSTHYLGYYAIHVGGVIPF